MMESIKNSEVSENKLPTVENYKDIKPQEGMTPEEAKNYWNEQFKNIELPIDEMSRNMSPDVDDQTSHKDQDNQSQKHKGDFGKRLEMADVKDGLSDAQKEKIKEETGWSNEIIDHISSKEQYAIYKKADLHEAEIDGRKCLLKNIDYDYVDPKTNLTNRELMALGRSPIDAKTGEKIELHHMGQSFDGPFAELCENSEHGDGNHDTLHPKAEGSWRKDLEKKSQYNSEKRVHWTVRSQEG